MATQDPFNDEWERLVRSKYSDVPEKDIDQLIYQAKRRRLDPLIRQLYATVRNVNVAKGNQPPRYEKRTTIEATIDGLRLIAERTGTYRGQTKPEWCGEDGQWVDIWLQKKPPHAARVGIHREGFIEPLYSPAKYDGFAQFKGDKPMGQWRNMADHMLAKCAEALALRKAYPEELSGIYTEEELAAQSPENEDPEPQKKRGPQGAAPVDDKALLDQLANARATPAGFLRTVKHVARDLARLPEKMRGVTWRALLSFASDASVTEEQVRAAMAEAREEAAREKETSSKDDDAKDGEHDRSQTFRFGPAPGVALRDMEYRHLGVYLDILQRSIVDPAKARYKASNEAQREAVFAEIGIRDAEMKTAADEMPSSETESEEDLPDSLAGGASPGDTGDLFDFGDD